MLRRLRVAQRVALFPARSAATLAFEEVSLATGAPQRTAVILHGLLGQARNWRGFTRRLLEAADAAGAPPTRILLPDLRHHGNTAAKCVWRTWQPRACGADRP